MAYLKGTNVAAPIVPYTDQDQYPTHYANYGFGGYMIFDTIEERNATPALRRREGMMCRVNATDKFYFLRGGIENVNWTVLKLYADVIFPIGHELLDENGQPILDNFNQPIMEIY